MQAKLVTRFVSIGLALAALFVLAVLAAAPARAAGTTEPAGWQKAFNFTSWTSGGYASDSADQALRNMQALGTNRVVLTPTWYMSTATSDTIAPDSVKTPSDSSLRTAMGRAHDLGMSVVLKPHVDVQDGTFRGQIQPTDPAAWFASYRTMLTHYADLAQSAGADTLVVGTELTSMSSDTAAWQQLIAVARQHFSGTLTYAANWIDEAQSIGFWGQLDAIGIDAYMPLDTNGATPTVASVAAAWQPYVQQITALHNSTGKPVMFTELGYQSVSGALANPASATGGPDAQLQATAYAAALQTWSTVPWFQGIWWWNWEAQPTGDAPATSFAVAGKPAAALLQAAQGGTGVVIDPASPVNGMGTTVPLGGGALILVALAAFVLRRRPAADPQTPSGPQPRPLTPRATALRPAAAAAPVRPALRLVPTQPLTPTFSPAALTHAQPSGPGGTLPPRLAAACLVPTGGRPAAVETLLPSRYQGVAA